VEKRIALAVTHHVGYLQMGGHGSDSAFGANGRKAFVLARLALDGMQGSCLLLEEVDLQGIHP
jgi:hypothetical protein